jgi:hypothetical protein
MLEKLMTENNFSDTNGNILNIDENSIQLNKPDYNKRNGV